MLAAPNRQRRAVMRPRTASKPEPDDEQQRLAVLIDADNAQPAVIEGLLAEVAKYGVASVKRIYGDFTSTRLSQWKEAALRFSINPVQQYAYTKGKNATDSTLIIDAMDLMYTRRFDGFCLVSSDSDFTRLAQRLREEGLTVYGFGERKTPDAFVRACDKFVYSDVLRAPEGAAKGGPGAQSGRPRGKPVPGPEAAQAAASPPPATPSPGKAAKAGAPAQVPIRLLRRAIEEGSNELGWAPLGAVGNYLTKIQPDFDPRTYKHRKLSDLLRADPRFELSEGANGLLVRLKA